MTRPHLIWQSWARRKIFEIQYGWHFGLKWSKHFLYKKIGPFFVQKIKHICFIRSASASKALCMTFNDAESMLMELKTFQITWSTSSLSSNCYLLSFNTFEQGLHIRHPFPPAIRFPFSLSFVSFFHCFFRIFLTQSVIKACFERVRCQSRRLHSLSHIWQSVEFAEAFTKLLLIIMPFLQLVRPASNAPSSQVA